MAEVSVNLETMSLMLEFDAGVVNGKQTLKNKSYSNIRQTATDESLLKTANTLAGLQERDLLTVRKRVTSSIRQ